MGGLVAGLFEGLDSIKGLKLELAAGNPTALGCISCSLTAVGVLLGWFSETRVDYLPFFSIFFQFLQPQTLAFKEVGDDLPDGRFLLQLVKILDFAPFDVFFDLFGVFVANSQGFDAF